MGSTLPYPPEQRLGRVSPECSRRVLSQIRFWSLAAALRPWRNSGWASAISACARSVDDRPLRFAAPNSVTMYGVSMRGVITGPSSRATMRETFPLAAVERAAIIDFPPFDAYAPRTKSSWPPDALY